MMYLGKQYVVDYELDLFFLAGALLIEVIWIVARAILMCKKYKEGNMEVNPEDTYDEPQIKKRNSFGNDEMPIGGNDSLRQSNNYHELQNSRDSLHDNNASSYRKPAGNNRRRR